MGTATCYSRVMNKCDGEQFARILWIREDSNKPVVFDVRGAFLWMGTTEACFHSAGYCAAEIIKLE